MPEENTEIPETSQETVGTDWKNKLSQLLKDKRILGAGAAGLAGATLGTLVAPDFIYKKPTWYNRLLLGAGAGVSSAAIVLAAMAAMQDKEPGAKPSWQNVASNTKDFFGQIPASLSGSRYSKQQVLEMTPGGKSVHGIYGGGLPGWVVRTWFKRPYGSIRKMFGYSEAGEEPTVGGTIGAWGKTLGTAGLAGLVGQQVTKGLDNAQRAREFIKATEARNVSLDPVAKGHIKRLSKRLNKNLFGQVAEAGKAAAANPAQILAINLQRLAHKYQRLSGLQSIARRMSDFAKGEKLWNPFLQTAGARSSSRFNTATPSRSMLGLFNRNAARFNVPANSKLTGLITADRLSKAFRGARGNKVLGTVAALATIAGIGKLWSLNSSDPYEQMVRYDE